MSQNTFALVPTKIGSSMTVSRSTVNPDWHTVVTNHNQAMPFYLLDYQGTTLQLRTINLSSNVSPTQTGQYFSGSFNLTLWFNFNGNYFPTSLLADCGEIDKVYLRPEQGTVVSENFVIQSCKGDYIINPGDSKPSAFYMNIKVQGSGKLSASTTVSSYVLSIQSDEVTPFFTGILPSPGTWGIFLPRNGLDINFNINNDSSTTGQGEINQNITNINNTINEQNQKENQAVDNISNQSPSDINNAENAATTNLIGVLSGFINAFSNINATNCRLTLEFPNYAGGSRVVDICQGKEKAPRIVEIGSSLLLIAVFVPLAYIMIKMIYNEIRSWTNG